MNDFGFDESNFEKEYDSLCESDGWNILFQRIKNNASFKMMNNACTVSRSNENRFKNKYREIVPYDYNRILLPRSSYFNSDYINASMVRVNERSYIVTQYPYKTHDLFWLMVWDSKSPGIIMLGKFEDSELDSYFPKTENDLQISSSDNNKIIFSIKMLDTESFNGFFQRKLQIYNIEADLYHELWHFEFWSWPDQGAPKCIYSFLTLLGVVRQLHLLDSPTHPAVIHCSAGAGRSGTFCLVDLAIMHIEKSKSLNDVDVSELIEYLRVQRMGMVHSIVQVKFSYEAIIAAFKRFKSSSDNEKIDGSYLLCNEESRMYNQDILSSSSSESAISDTVYYHLSDEDNDSDQSDNITHRMNKFYEEFAPDLTEDINSSNYESYLDVLLDLNETTSDPMEDNSLTHEEIIKRRKLKNQQNIDLLSKYLSDNNLKRFRIMSGISSSTSLPALDQFNNNYYWSMFVVTGTICFMGAYLLLKYNPFK